MKPLIGITAGLSDAGGTSSAVYSLKREYVDAIRLAGGVPFLVPADGTAGENVLDLFDGILIPGGDDIAPSCYGEEPRYPLKLVEAGRAEFELSLARAAYHLRLPLLGICYGMQLMNVALGGTLYQDLTEFEVLSRIKDIDHRQMHYVTVSGAKGNFGAKGAFPSEGRFLVNSSHHQGIKKTAEGLIVTAFSDDGLTEAVCCPEQNQPFFAGVQWHPERMPEDPMTQKMSQKLFSSFVEAASRVAAGRGGRWNKR